jgi:polysaccharide biosynthesis transport protein
MNRESDFQVDGAESQGGSTNILKVIWQRKGFVVLGALVGLAVGFLFHTQKSPVYATSSSVLIIKKAGAPPTSGGSGPRAQDIVAEDYMATQSVVFRSPVVVISAVANNGLADLESLRNMDAVGAIISNLTVSRDTKETQGAPNNIMQIGFRCGVADDCPKIVKAVTAAYRQFLETKYNYTSQQIMAALNNAREIAEKSKNEAEKKQIEFIRSNRKFLSSPVEVESAAKLEKDYRDQKIKVAELEAMIERLEAAIKEGHGRYLVPLSFTPGGTGKERDNQQLRAIEEPMIAAKLKLAKDRQFYGKGHPEIISQENGLKIMREEYERIAPPGDEELAKRYLQGLKTDLANASSLMRGIKGPREEAIQAMIDLAPLQFEEKNLAADVARNRQLFDETVKMLQSLDLRKADQGFDATVLGEPGVGFKVLPIAMLDLGAGLVIGLLLGAGLAYLADASDKSFRGPDEIRRRLGLPLVGHIPHFKPEAELARRRDAGEATIDPMLVTHLRPKSVNAESYRAVRTSLFFSTQGQGHRVIQVTSPNKGDGKSLLCSNLAITIAQSGKRVLLIDADCRRPRQHKVFNVPHDVGLASVLMGTTMAHEAVQQTTIPGLDIMPCGPIPPNPSELLVSPRFKEVLEMFRADYDFVLVDTPPVLAVTDPCVVAGKVDGLVVAIRLTRKGRPDAERAKEILTQVGANVFGIVVNGVTQTSTGVYTAQAYDYTYDYEEDDPKNHEYYSEDEEAETTATASS